MDKKQILLFSIVFTMLFGGIYLFSTVNIVDIDDEIKHQDSKTLNTIQSANGIPFDYYQEIEIGENYIYNVTGFGVDAVWAEFPGSADWKTDIDEQIYINFTGFFDRDPNVPEDTFPDVEMHWINISIFESGALLNYTNANVSNSEVSRNLKLGFADFQPGFLISVNHTDWIKANATLEANGASGPKADLTMEETYNFIYLGFEQYGSAINQITKLIYDKKSGLLVKAYTKYQSYELEISLTNYSLDFDTTYEYNVLDYGGPGQWWSFSTGFSGFFVSTSGSPINVSFNGYFDKDPNDWVGDIFNDPNLKRAWLNVSIYYLGDFPPPMPSMTVKNCSNREAASNMLLGYMDFQSGFLIPYMNETFLKLKAQEQSNKFGNLATISSKESDLTIKFIFQQTLNSFAGFEWALQHTTLIYEKLTGLLLWADTDFKDYELKITLNGYEPQSEDSVKSTSSDDDDDDKTKAETIHSFPLLITFGAIAITTVMIILKKKTNIKIKNV